MRDCHTCTRKYNIFDQHCIRCLDLRKEYNAEYADLYNLFDKIYSLDFLIPAKSIKWSDITIEKEKTWEKINSQTASVKLLCDLIKEANQYITPETQELIIQKVYIYVLALCADLCVEGANMFKNPAEYKSYFDKFRPLARDKDSAIKVLTTLKNADYMYKVFAGCQGIYAAQIIPFLDKELLLFVEELHEPVRKLAVCFNTFFLQNLKRWIDYYMSPGTDAIEDMWKNYLNIRNCLMPDVIQTLDESSWKLAINDQVEKHNQRSFMYAFLRRQKADTAAHELNIKIHRIRYYLKTHPQEKAKLEHWQTLEAENNQVLLKIRNRIAEFEEKKFPYSTTVAENARILAEKEAQYKKLESKNSEKHPVTDQLAALNKDMRKIQGIIDSANIKIAHYDKRIGFQNDDLQKIMSELEKLWPQRQQMKMDMEEFYRNL